MIHCKYNYSYLKCSKQFNSEQKKKKKRKKKSFGSFKNSIKKKCLQIYIHILYVWIKWYWHLLTYNGW